MVMQDVHELIDLYPLYVHIEYLIKRINLKISMKMMINIRIKT